MFPHKTNLLTKREKQIMELIIMGFTVPMISKTLFISETTVITHKENIKVKLHAKNSCNCVSLYLIQKYLVKNPNLLGLTRVKIHFNFGLTSIDEIVN